jgi:nicotinate-nucleotide adenylyltransferase
MTLGSCPALSRASRLTALGLDGRVKPGHDERYLWVVLFETRLILLVPARPPPFVPGLKVGLFGGSFNPPHEGHRAASLLALRRLNLHRIWWLVSPGNPLKDARELAPLTKRVEAARRASQHPRIEVIALEVAIGATYTYQTISYLKRRCPGVHFVWLMGADNFRLFDRWQRWRDIARLLPIAIVDRPGSTLTALHGRAAQALAPFRRDESCAPALATTTLPAFVFLHWPRSEMSSTELRGRTHPASAQEIMDAK